MMLMGSRKRPWDPDMSRGIVLGIFVSLSILPKCLCVGEEQYGYFSKLNNSEVLLKQTEWSIQSSSPTGFSFRTCSNGELLYQRGVRGDLLKLLTINGSLEFHFSVGINSNFIVIGQNFNNNEWYTVNLQLYLGNLYLNISKGGNLQFSEILSNSTHRTFLSDVDLSGSVGLYVGRNYTGCFMQGPNVQFTTSQHVQWTDVEWSSSACNRRDNCNIISGDIDDCATLPCGNGGSCLDGINNYTCICHHLYNGTNCENDLSIYGCAVDPCLNGGSCVDEVVGTKNYRCDCPDGFAGNHCELEIDECGSQPCKNGGQCIDVIAGYQCNCTGVGFTGTLCDVDIDECLATSDICGTSGQCHNNPGSYSCSCPLGQIGHPCQEINECDSNPCQNSATCVDLAADYTCNCVPGYSGKQCEEDIDDCDGVICTATHSECQDLVNDHNCVCRAGYHGAPPNCQDINECDPDPCVNGATCNNLENQYRCDCVPGYDGPDCAHNIDDCDPNPCLYGASCEDKVNNYNCSCVAGYDGRNCGTNIDDCASKPCRHGGTCNDQVNGYNCTCSLGYTGGNCETDINECDPDPCIAAHSSGCTDNVGYFSCSCLDGYSGNTCETNIDDCSPNPCQNGGACADLVNDYNCTCLPSWMGERCEQIYNACSPVLDNCKNGASCTTSPPSHDFNCTCVLGFDGRQCDNNIDDCAPDLCSSPLVCFDEVNNYTCACPRGYEGTNCDQVIDQCRDDPCRNGGTCVGDIGSYTCQCPQTNMTILNSDRWFISGFEGDNCEHDIDECTLQPPICLNNGLCENANGSYECLCRKKDGSIFTAGTHCETETSYCFVGEELNDGLDACQNNGTCTPDLNTFHCSCAPGFTERRCTKNIDECESNPCQYNGTCVDGIAMYTCSCIAGITGSDCEINIDECEGNPCLHDGECIDGINMFTCNCSDTGYEGATCEIDIDECLSQPCLHGSTCNNLLKDYSCDCFTGYNGKSCENDVNECQMNPCDDTYPGSTCYQRSIETYYEIDTPGFENLTFTYATAAGYICDCIKGITGNDCETNINDCFHDTCNGNGTCEDLIDAYTCHCFPGYEDNNCETEINECLQYEPCQNGGTCTDQIADYNCNCDSIWAGKNCTFFLTSCNSHECQNGATCEPYLIDETTRKQDYNCKCTAGFTGRYCNISTTMSFNSGSFVNITLDQVNDISVSFRFRTTLQDGLLLAWLAQGSTHLFSTVELQNGGLIISYYDTAINTRSKISINRNFNDGKWQTVTLRLNSHSAFLTFVVHSSSCSIPAECIKMMSYNEQIHPHTNVYLASLSDVTIMNDTETGSQFVGCMEDVTVAENKLVLIPGSSMFHDVVAGCPRQEQCYSETCNGKGTCVDLWNDYSCDCYRPHLGRNCETAYVAATFAYNNNADSWAAFDLSQNQQQEIQHDIDLSFFFRSRKADGLILFMGNVAGNFLALELNDEHLVVRMKFCETEKHFQTSSNTYANGEQHFVELIRNDGDFNFSVDGVLNRHEQVRSTCAFDASGVIFGGVTEIPNQRRKKRETITLPADSVSDFSSATNYKGTIQDVQLNSYSLQFFESSQGLSDLPVILMAPTSSSIEPDEKTDAMCDIYQPCDNNSTCKDHFFNDYKCACPHGYMGKNCSELDFCVTGTCPAGSTCHGLLDGFECISVSTFNGRDSYAFYSHNLPNTSVIQTFSFKFRTHAQNGWLLSISNGNHYYKVKVIGSHIVVLYKLNDIQKSVESIYDSSDAKWYMAVVTETLDTVTLTLFDSDNGYVLSNVSSNKPNTGESLTSILQATGNEIKIGNDGNYNPRNPYYQGCLTEVRIGKILLPFFNDDLFINNTSIERFLLGGHRQIPSGCRLGSNCLHNQCQHESHCQEDYYSYTCNCSAGNAGEWCQDRREYCTADSCENGHCTSRVDNFECVCPSGYTGSRCEVDVDECAAAGACQNGATCDNQNGTYTCNCSDLYTGDYCEISLNQTCSSSPCVNGQCNTISLTDSATGLDVESFNCSCDPGYHGYICNVAIDYCEDLPCLNGGNCTSQTSTQDFRCSCIQGYTGDRCETNVDDCPSPSPCLHGGVCVDGLDSFVCNCTDTQYWTGKECELDIDECTVSQPCQNGGLCLNIDNGYLCDCRDTGYEGQDCADDIDECSVGDGPCLNGATCNNTVGSYDCNCTLGYEGPDCGTPDCTDVQCQNTGTCVVEGDNSRWSCQCLDFYEGQFCEVKGLCVDKPCDANNTQKCTQNTTADTYTCHCNSGWEGDVCETDIDECETIPGLCQNGATCYNRNGTYRCYCVTGYTGQTCDGNIDECAPEPCHNNGICIDGIGEFTCNCTETGYSNLTCQDDVNECEETIPCLHDGTCTNTVGGYDCACMDGYQGQDCEVKRSPIMDDDDDITWYIVGPSVAVVIFLVVIGIVWFLLCVRNKRATHGAYSPSRQEVTGSQVELGNVLKKPPPERLI